MLEIGFPVLFVSIFCDSFHILKASFCWQIAISQLFDPKSGALQGSFLGTKFHNLFMDKFLFLLQKSNLGYRIGGIFIGAVFYADDLILMSASCVKL